jgi:hypothetical protein
MGRLGDDAEPWSYDWLLDAASRAMQGESLSPLVATIEAWWADDREQTLEKRTKRDAFLVFLPAVVSDEPREFIVSALERGSLSRPAARCALAVLALREADAGTRVEEPPPARSEWRAPDPHDPRWAPPPANLREQVAETRRQAWSKNRPGPKVGSHQDLDPETAERIKAEMAERIDRGWPAESVYASYDHIRAPSTLKKWVLNWRRLQRGTL